MQHHETFGNTRVYSWQLERAGMLCSTHGWQGSCTQPCTLVRTFAPKNKDSPPCNDARRPPHPELLPATTAELLARAVRAAASGGAEAARPEWRGKIVRVRSFVDDGFWVRAHFVIAHGLWASLRGLPFFVHLHSNASCAHIGASCAAERAQSKEYCAQRHTCDAYSSGGTAWRAPGWEEYFEPIGGVPSREVYRRTPPERFIELSCSTGWYVTEGLMGGRMATKEAWGSGYPQDWRGALAFRARNAALVAAWVRVRAEILMEAESEWQRLVHSGGPVIGVHLRGTDKFVAPKVPPERYYALIDAFLAHHGNARRPGRRLGNGGSGGSGGGRRPLIFLATDDLNYQRSILERYGAQRVLQLRDGKISRAVGNSAVWMERDASTAHAKGLEVLLDTLLLSKCDFLLKSASAVSEFALYFNPRLHNESYDFEIPDQPLPPWFHAASAASLAR